MSLGEAHGRSSLMASPRAGVALRGRAPSWRGGRYLWEALEMFLFLALQTSVELILAYAFFDASNLMLQEKDDPNFSSFNTWAEIHPG